MSANARSRILSVFIVLILGLLMFGCKPKNQSELYGEYMADYIIAKENLTLNGDGTFIQKVTIKETSKVDVAKGTWTFDKNTGYITFNDNMMLVLDGFRKFNSNYTNPKPGLVVEPVNKSFGRITLGTAEGVLYEKIN